MSDEFIGYDEFISKMNDAASRLRSEMGKSLYRCGEIVRRSVVTGIRSQKWKGQWPPLKEETLKRKRKSNRKNKGKGSGLILIDKGDYLSSFAVAMKSDEEVHIGTNHPQARAQELGYETGGIPKRPHLLPAFEESMEEIKDELFNTFKGLFE